MSGSSSDSVIADTARESLSAKTILRRISFGRSLRTILARLRLSIGYFSKPHSCSLWRPIFLGRRYERGTSLLVAPGHESADPSLTSASGGFGSVYRSVIGEFCGSGGIN